MGITAFPFSSVIDVPTARILGRDDAGTGSAEALTTAEVLALLSVYTTAQVDSLLSGKSNTGHTHAASDITSGIIATARLATGTPSASTYLRGDGTWAAVSAGISSLNGLTNATQTFAVGTSGTDVAFVSAAGVHTLNIPDASATARGVVTTGTQTFAGEKTFAGDLWSNTAVFISGNRSNFDYYRLQRSGTAFGGGTGGSLAIFSQWSGEFVRLAIDRQTGIVYVANGIIGAGERLRIQKGATSQGVEVYNTYTSDTSFERLSLSWASNVCYIGTEKGSAGGTARDLTLGTDGAVRLVLPAASTSGALYLGPRADNTATGGNARGSGAADLQTSRTLASQVASGANAFIFGDRNTASNTNCFSGGANNTSSGINSFSYGVNCESSGNASFSTGQGSISTGQVAFSCGSTTASGNTAFSTGTGAVAFRPSQFSHSSGRFSVNGDGQYTRLVGGAKTIGLTPAFITLSGVNSADGSGNWLSANAKQISIATGTLLSFLAMITGAKSDGSSVAFYVRKGTIKNVGGTVTLVSLETIGTDIEDTANTNVNITADNVSKFLSIQLTGIENETWRWFAAVEAIEITFGV